MTKYLYGIAFGLLMVSVSSTIYYKYKYNSATNQLSEIRAQSLILEQRIRDENDEFERQRKDFKERLEQADKQRAKDVSDARNSFIAERMRLQADSELHRKESESYTASFANCNRHRAETERLLLRTLDEAELINSAYVSCRTSLLSH